MIRYYRWGYQVFLCIVRTALLYNYYEFYQKISPFPAYLLKRKGGGGGRPKPFCMDYFFAPALSSSYYSLENLRFLPVSSKCEGGMADAAWRQQSSGSSRKTENHRGKKIHQTRRHLLGHPAHPLAPTSPLSLSHGSAKAAVKDSSQVWLLTTTARPFFQLAEWLRTWTAPWAEKFLKLLWTISPRAIAPACNAAQPDLSPVPDHCPPSQGSWERRRNPHCPQSHHRPCLLEKHGSGQKLGPG